jgi:hypothetical protein
LARHRSATPSDHTREGGVQLAQGALSVDELAAANGLSSDAALAAGSTVLIPPVSGTAPTEAGDSSGSGRCAWDCNSTVHPHPTDETVTPERVGQDGVRLENVEGLVPGRWQPPDAALLPLGFGDCDRVGLAWVGRHEAGREPALEHFGCARPEDRSLGSSSQSAG